MKIGLVTDSTCDIDPDILKKHDIEMVPLNIIFSENETYKDIVDINQESFFDKLVKAEKLPTTSQPAVGLFAEKYSEMVDKYDAIISIHIADKLSGTCKSALMASTEFEDTKIEVIDSRSTSLGLGYQVLLAKRLIEEGFTIEEIKASLEKARENLRIYFTVNDLSYLQKGGRIGKAQAFLGSILNFYPILALSSENGEILPLEKVRGKKKIAKRLEELSIQELENIDKASLGFIHASEREYYDSFYAKLNDKLSDKDINYSHHISWISAVLGSHVGPSVYGVVILKGDLLEI
ncbi:DegV family protein [Natronospora cellulosivora (SeqCode)]